MKKKSLEIFEFRQPTRKNEIKKTGKVISKKLSFYLKFIVSDLFLSSISFLNIFFF